MASVFLYIPELCSHLHEHTIPHVGSSVILRSAHLLNSCHCMKSLCLSRLRACTCSSPVHVWFVCHTSLCSSPNLLSLHEEYMSLSVKGLYVFLSCARLVPAHYFNCNLLSVECEHTILLVCVCHLTLCSTPDVISVICVQYSVLHAWCMCVISLLFKHFIGSCGSSGPHFALLIFCSPAPALRATLTRDILHCTVCTRCVVYVSTLLSCTSLTVHCTYVCSFGILS